VSVLAGATWTPRTACADAPPFVPAAGEVLDTAQTSSSARLHVRASGDALLVCSITRHKYWRASVDGRPADLIPVNLAYQAVRLPAGEHRVELRYHNPLIAGFGVVSIIALIAVVILAIIPQRDRAQL
jgi:uncharacterized membrane protein YfhO